MSISNVIHIHMSIKLLYKEFFVKNNIKITWGETKINPQVWMRRRIMGVRVRSMRMGVMGFGFKIFLSIF